LADYGNRRRRVNHEWACVPYTHLAKKKEVHSGRRGARPGRVTVPKQTGTDGWSSSFSVARCHGPLRNFIVDLQYMEDCRLECGAQTNQSSRRSGTDERDSEVGHSSARVQSHALRASGVFAGFRRREDQRLLRLPIPKAPA
jgi:hypothetical protein